MDYLIVFALGFVVGYAYLVLRSWLLLRKLIRSVAQESNQKPDVKERNVTAEVIGNELFAYDKDSGQFLCKFTSLEDLKTSLRRIDKTCNWYVDVTFDAIVKEHLKEQR